MVCGVGKHLRKGVDIMSECCDRAVLEKNASENKTSESSKTQKAWEIINSI